MAEDDGVERRRPVNPPLSLMREAARDAAKAEVREMFLRLGYDPNVEASVDRLKENIEHANGLRERAEKREANGIKLISVLVTALIGSVGTLIVSIMKDHWPFIK